MIPRSTERVDPGQTYRQKHCIMLFGQLCHAKITANLFVMFDCNAANLEQPSNFALCEAIDGFIAGDAVFI